MRGPALRQLVPLRSLLLVLLVLLAVGRLRLPVVVLRLARPGGRVRLAPLLRGRLAVLEAAETRLLPGQVLLGTRPGAGFRSLLLVLLVFGVGRADGGQSVVTGPVPVPLVRVVLAGFVVLRSLVAGRLLLLRRRLGAGARPPSRRR